MIPDEISELMRVFSPQNPVTVIVEDDVERHHSAPKDERRLILNRKFWQTPKPTSVPTKPVMKKSKAHIPVIPVPD